MSGKRNTPAQLRAALEAIEACSSVSEAARSLGIPRGTLIHQLENARKNPPPPEIEYPQFPEDDIPVEDLIDSTLIPRFEKRQERAQALQWFDLKVNIDGPVGVTFFGDPHVDDNGCNWPLLKSHCEIHARTEGLYAVNIGDTTNNWVGRLGRLFAEQEASQTTARKLAYWLMADSGVTWLAWLIGNHDMWNEGDEILKRMNAQRIAMRKEKFPGMDVSEWQARFSLLFPNKRRCRIWASHDFPGHSMWNSLHGALRAAHMKEMAQIYVCGHKHNWAMHKEESGSKGFVYWLLRARGYKEMDNHAIHMGHDDQVSGASITAIIDPSRDDASMVSCFDDMSLAADFLTFLRKKT